MAVCSFLGHADVYDADIENRLQAAVDRIVAENDTVEFLLHDHGEFYNQCLLAAMRVRACNPQKVTLTLISDCERENAIKYYNGMIGYNRDVSLCIVDKVIAPYIAPSNGKIPSVSFKRLVRWVIQNSTHLISYVYRELHQQINHLLSFAANQPLKIFPIINEDTTQAIIAFSAKLTTREHFVFEEANKGQVQHKIAASLNVANSRVGEILHHGCWTIHRHLKRWYYAKLAAAGGRQVRSCSIFYTNKVTGETLPTYKSLISFLIAKCDVGYFYIEYTHPYSNILCNVVKEKAKHHPHHITVVTDSEEYLEPIEKPEDIIPAFYPPYDTLACIAQLDPGIAQSPSFLSILIDRADFCICDLSASHYSDAIKNYVSQKGGTVLLDIGKANTYFP